MRMPAMIGAVAALFAVPAMGQDTDMICFSVGDAATQTVIVLYGRDGAMVSMLIPPDGTEEAAQTAVIAQSPEVFSAMEAVLAPGLAALPPAPDAAGCQGDTLGSVAIAVRREGQPLQLYDAPCATPEVLQLNEAMITATGDPLGTQTGGWSTAIIPAQRDICMGM